jgi:hypothetical protein
MAKLLHICIGFIIDTIQVLAVLSSLLLLLLPYNTSNVSRNQCGDQIA